MEMENISVSNSMVYNTVYEENKRKDSSTL